MLFHFSLYGFLKNQRYFEPFLLLVFLEKGFSFFEIGLLIGFKGLCTALFEIPSGAFADLFGRRKIMLLSFTAYIISFILFATAPGLALFFLAMLFYSLGDSFRTGTHKAMIFDWLRTENRLDEKVKIYGYTRSWSKFGSATSALIAMGCLLLWRQYDESISYASIFWLCLIPYGIGIINFLFYPESLDRKQEGAGFKDIFNHLKQTSKKIFKETGLKKLLSESLCYDGLFQVSKDYLQPVLKSLVLLLPIFLFEDKEQQTTLLAGSIYFVLAILSMFASRYAHLLTKKLGGETNTCQKLWNLNFLIYLGLGLLLYYQLWIYATILFILLNIVQNLWRPNLISRFDTYSDKDTGATVLSIESQAKSLFVFFVAPIIGYLIDLGEDGKNFCVIGVLGAVVSLFVIFLNRKQVRR